MTEQLPDDAASLPASPIEAGAADRGPQPLPPGAGSPLVPGPAHSAGPPIGAGRLNTAVGVAGLVGIALAVLVLGLVVVLAVSLLSHR
jgi:hypothetical protein